MESIVRRLPKCRPAQHDGCAAQANPTPDLTLTPNPNAKILGGSRSARGVARGSIVSLCLGAQI